MTREQKISLIVGFTLVLLVGVAVSDHLSAARSAQLESGLTPPEAQSDFDAPQRPIPESKPLDAFAAAPEKPAEVSPGPIARGLDDAMKPSTDFLDRLRNRVQDLPVAADTVTRTESPPQPQLIIPAPKRDAKPPASETTWHSVEEGDTFWSIAERHYGDGALAPKLAAFNNARADLLRAGVRLRIPPRSALTGEAGPARPGATEAAPARKPAPTRDYTVKPGDTLGVIAQRELGTVKRMGEILKLNPTLPDADSIQVGNVIKLPVR